MVTVGSNNTLSSLSKTFSEFNAKTTDDIST